MFATPKYKGFPDPIDNVPMDWNVHPDGYPIRHGNSPLHVKKEQLSHAGYTLFARSVVLRIPEKIEEYNKITDWLANTPSLKMFERVREDPADAGTWIVWLGWIEARGVIPSTPAV